MNDGLIVALAISLLAGASRALKRGERTWYGWAALLVNAAFTGYLAFRACAYFGVDPDASAVVIGLASVASHEILEIGSRWVLSRVSVVAGVPLQESKEEKDA